MKWILILIILMISLVSAADFTPQGDINLRDTYNIENALAYDGVNATFDTNVTAQWFVGNLSAPSVAIIGNLTIGQKITFALGEIIDNIVNGVIRVTGDFLSTGTINATKFYGTYNWTEGSSYLSFDGTTLSFNETALNVTIGIFNDSMKSYVDAQDTAFNDSMKSYTDGTFITQANEGNLDVNRSDYWDDYNTPAAIKSGDSDLLDSYNSLFFAPLNTSMIGNFDFEGQIDFNGGWTSNGLSIINGDVYAQRGYFYNISGLNVTTLAINGSILPDITNQFDIGNATFKWRHGFFSGNLSVDTSVLFVDSVSDRVGIGTNAPDSIFHIKANVVGTVGSHPAGQLIIQDPDDTVFGNAVITGYESDGAGNPDQQLWYLGSSSGSTTNIIFLNRRNAKLQLGTNDVSRLTILGDGNVGIGTTSPDFKLQVNGSIAPETTSLFDIGSSALRWLKGWFVNLDVSNNVSVGGNLTVLEDLNVTGKIHNNLAHVTGFATAVQTVAVVDTWYNITMNRTFAHNFGFELSTDNITIIIPHDGHYTITFGMGIINSVDAGEVAMRIAINGAELVGSYIGDSTSKQNTERWLEHVTHAELNTGDEVRLQYIASVDTITIDQADTYATQGFSAFGYIQEAII